MRGDRNPVSFLFRFICILSLAIMTGFSPNVLKSERSIDPFFGKQEVATPTINPDSVISTPVPIKLPELTLIKGEPFFRVGGIQTVIFSRNIAGYNTGDYQTLIRRLPKTGTRLVRLQVPTNAMGGTGYTSDGSVDEEWAKNWDAVLQTADEQGISVFITLSGWIDWTSKGVSEWDWRKNPMNAVNGGPARTTHDLYEKDSPTQKLLFRWMGQIIDRWQSHTSIVIWEPFSEINLGDSITQDEAIYFSTKFAELVKQHDPAARPVTVSLADFGNWNNFYANPALDLINIHPYPVSGKLDLKVLSDIPKLRERYKKPVMIGESGLDFNTPDHSGSLTLARNVRVGLRHAIWSGIVSGSMNARAFWWEDGFGLYFQSLSWDYVNKLNDLEKPAAAFIRGLDMTGYTPVSDAHKSRIIGGVIGNDRSMIGWYRDSSCEPPDWNTDARITGQTVELTLPSEKTYWTVDFYDTGTGDEVITSATFKQDGPRLIVPIPDFSNDIAFKLTKAENKTMGMDTSDSDSAESHNVVTLDQIQGVWKGTIFSETGSFSTPVTIRIQNECRAESICGTVSAPGICSGDLYFSEFDGTGYRFIEKNMKGANCRDGGMETLIPLSSGTLEYHFQSDPNYGVLMKSKGVLKHTD